MRRWTPSLNSGGRSRQCTLPHPNRSIDRFGWGSVHCLLLPPEFSDGVHRLIQCVLRQLADMGKAILLAEFDRREFGIVEQRQEAVAFIYRDEVRARFQP